MMKRARRNITANDRPQESGDVRDCAGHGAKSAGVRQRAVLALLSEGTIVKAATKCGLSEKTLRRWMADDEDFKRDLAEARRLAYDEGINRMQALMPLAIETLAGLMRGNVPPNVRLGAARTVVELGTHQHDADTILRRLEEIETHQRQQKTAERR
jgi:hypothetical protein